MGTQRAEYLVIRVKFDEPIPDLAMLRDMGFSQEVGRWRLAMEWRMGKRRDVNRMGQPKGGFRNRYKASHIQGIQPRRKAMKEQMLKLSVPIVAQSFKADKPTAKRLSGVKIFS